MYTFTCQEEPRAAGGKIAVSVLGFKHFEVIFIRLSAIEIFLSICLFSQSVFGEVSWEIARGETKKNKLSFITLFPRSILLLIKL